MNTRRDFLKAAAALAAPGVMPSIIQRAAAIEPAAGSTFLDAAHVVVLMQENRSFDHMLGLSKGRNGLLDVQGRPDARFFNLADPGDRQPVLPMDEPQGQSVPAAMNPGEGGVSQLTYQGGHS